VQLQESGEMYLETILVLTRESNFVRSVDVGEHMGFSKPSVSRAMGLLKNGGYITVGEDGAIRLTEIGTEIAEKIYERHTILTKWLTDIGVDPEIASEDACKIEHHLSDVTFEAIKSYIQNK